MPLESVTFISDLVVTNPVNATDQVAQGDDHIRNIKSALLATFPNITGAVTPTHTELNYVDGVTSAIQAQIDGKAATSHAHSAADLTSGTIPDARFPSTLPALNGSALTALNASNIASGSLADARLSANVALLSGSQTFSGTKTFGGMSLTGAMALGTGGFFLSDATNGFRVNDSANTVNQFVISAVGNFNFKAGSVTTDHLSAFEVGYQGAPFNSQSGNYTLVLTDAAKAVDYTGTGGHTVTIPANASVAFPIGTVVVFINSGSGTLSIAITTDSLLLAGTATTGTRTLASGGVASAIKVRSGAWYISGAGLS